MNPFYITGQMLVKFLLFCKDPFTACSLMGDPFTKCER